MAAKMICRGHRILTMAMRRQRRGAGGALLQIAKGSRSVLSPWTFQRNAAARLFYERRGFVAVEETDGGRNEEREPDVLYRWQAG